MDERHLEKVKKHLRDAEVQERIQQSIQRGRLEATVTIGRVAQLFHLKESKLRDWETHGLLTPLRSKDNTGQRQYSPGELDKLAIIKELIDEGGFSPGDIPNNLYDIWNSISDSNGQKEAIQKPGEPQNNYLREVDRLPIDQRVERGYYKELFWRYYASHALWLSLMLICEDIPNSIAGIILPLQIKDVPISLCDPENVYKIGDALVGWLGQSRSFYTFLSSAPAFEHPSDFRILPLHEIEENTPKGGTPEDPTLIVIQRKTTLTLSQPVVDVIRRLLEPLYNEVPDWHLYLGQGMRDLLDPVIDFNSGTILPDTILTGLAERVVHMGGQTDDRQYRWRFCCILVPNNSQLPLQQRSLVVRAKSKGAPYEYKVGTTIVTPDKANISISLRAFQGGRIIYRHMVTPEDPSIAHLDKEEPIRSAIAIAIPVGGEDGMPVAVIYVVSAESDAFSEGDRRLLRLVGRMVEELLRTYEVRIRVKEQFTSLIKNPSIADPSFEGFSSENDFISDVETLLNTLRKRIEERKEGILEESVLLNDLESQHKTERPGDEVVSFIAIDIDNQTSLTNKYGDKMTRNLSRVVGLRILRQLRVLFTNPENCKLYHAYADRFYLLLKGVPLEQARAKAWLFRKVLNGSYSVDALRSSSEQPPVPENMIVTPEITVRLGVAAYLYKKLEELLQRYPAATAVASSTALICRDLDAVLRAGQDEGGDVIMSWEPEIHGFVRLSPETQTT